MRYRIFIVDRFMRLPASVYPRLAGGVSYPVGSVVDNECKRLQCVSRNIDSYRPRSRLFVCSCVRRHTSDFLPTIPNPVRLSLICCLLFKETSVSAKRVSLALYFRVAFHNLPSIHSVSGYVLPLSMLSNIEATRSVYMCNSYTIRSHALTFSPPLLTVWHPCPL